jgi:hypothetical protein
VGSTLPGSASGYQKAPASSHFLAETPLAPPSTAPTSKNLASPETASLFRHFRPPKQACLTFENCREPTAKRSGRLSVALAETPLAPPSTAPTSKNLASPETASLFRHFRPPEQACLTFDNCREPTAKRSGAAKRSGRLSVALAETPLAPPSTAPTSKNLASPETASLLRHFRPPEQACLTFDNCREPTAKRSGRLSVASRKAISGTSNATSTKGLAFYPLENRGERPAKRSQRRGLAFCRTSERSHRKGLASCDRPFQQAMAPDRRQKVCPFVGNQRPETPETLLGTAIRAEPWATF